MNSGPKRFGPVQLKLKRESRWRFPSPGGRLSPRSQRKSNSSEQAPANQQVQPVRAGQVQGGQTPVSGGWWQSTEGHVLPSIVSSSAHKNIAPSPSLDASKAVALGHLPPPSFRFHRQGSADLATHPISPTNRGTPGVSALRQRSSDVITSPTTLPPPDGVSAWRWDSSALAALPPCGANTNKTHPCKIPDRD